MHLAVVVFDLLLIVLLISSPKYPRLLLVAAFLGLIAALVATSPVRPVGDSGEYLAMSLNMARLERPSLSSGDIQRVEQRLPGDAATRLVMPQYLGADGRQDLPHFWFYSLLAAPFVRAALALGQDPLWGFTALNVVLLLATAWIVRAYAPVSVTLLLAAGPILWWVDKAHTEVFTFSLLTIGVLLLRQMPWWSVVAFGVAATQNPPIAGAMAIALGYGLCRFGWRDSRLWFGAALGAGLASWHPIYYHARLGVWSALRAGVDWHVPSVRELITPAFDPNLGIFIHDPFLTTAVAVALIAALWRRPAGLFKAEHAAVLIVAALFTVSFAQTTNFNSGGTPDPSRYGLWLLPLTIPVLRTVADRAAWLRVLAAASVLWCSVHFVPELPDHYLSPTPLAAAIWQRWPGLDNPLAEIFSERVSAVEPAPHPPLATGDCEKALLAGNDGNERWPRNCTPAAVPDFCRETGTLCYANRTGASYHFTRAPASPAWLVQQATRPSAPTAAPDATIRAYVLPSIEHLAPAVWLESGWSYLEREPEAGGVAWRWMADQAQIGITASAPTAARLRIVARAFTRERRLLWSIGQTPLTTMGIAEKRAVYETPRFLLRPGANVVTVKSLDGAEPAGDGNPRLLSVAVFHVDVIVEK